MYITSRTIIAYCKNYIRNKIGAGTSPLIWDLYSTPACFHSASAEFFQNFPFEHSQNFLVWSGNTVSFWEAGSYKKTAHGHLVHSYRSLQNSQQWCQLWAGSGTPCSQINNGLFKLLAVYCQKVKFKIQKINLYIFWRFSAARREKKNSKNLHIHIYGFHCVAKRYRRMIKDL